MDKGNEIGKHMPVSHSSLYSKEDEKKAHINILINSLEDPDPFSAYHAAEALHEYINTGYANCIVDVLHQRQTPVDETSHTHILELLHVLLKHVRKQRKKGNSVDTNYVINLLKLFPVFNEQPTDHFNAVASPSPYYILVVIDLFKVMQLGQEHDPVSSDHGGPYHTLPLSTSDIGKAIVRKSLELLWRNVNVTDVASTIEMTLSVAMAYVFSAFNSGNDIVARLAKIDTEFFYSPLSDYIAVDRESLKRAIKTCLASFVSAFRLINSDVHHPSSNVYRSLGNAASQIHGIIQLYCHDQGKPALVDLFMNICGNEDNDMVAIQHSLLQLAVTATKFVRDQQLMDSEGLTMCERIIELVDPKEADGGIKHAELFVHILFRMGLDHTTLLDMLISADTQFLKFFMQFLRYAEDNTQDFKLACARAAVDLLQSDEDDLSDAEADSQMLEIVSEILEALSADLKMSEFPYNPKVLMIRIQNVIDKLSTDL
ncbi:hypothetical protein INT44_007326 [Umbelopsis vinacea]|uniref:Protein Lines N-terminal domain-containing protein n=1 Tax=Umbelopsis vinacea TaxID=44442 RepID=A0A8H7UCM9_9FUNG|nr:hypothetical protein INT44_007326 [Umbelopsis vinacea]